MNKVLAFAGPHIEAGARIMLAIFLALGLLISLVYVVLQVTHKYQLDYGEAPLVDQSRRLGNGENIYRRDLSTPPYNVTNYPPLYVLILTPFTKVLGPSFIPGRMLSLASTICSAIFLGGIIYNLSRDRWAARMTGAVFLTFPFVVEWSALARVDMLALAFSTGAIYTGTKPEKTQKSITTSAVLLAASIFTRQSYGLAAPLALFVWTFIENKRHAFMLAGITAGIGSLLVIILNLITKGGFLFHIISANVNPFDWSIVGYYAYRFREAAPILLILTTAYCCFTEYKNRNWQLAIPYLLGSAGAALTIGKVGSNVNYLLELCAALSLITGLLLTWQNNAKDKPDEEIRLAIHWLPVIRGALYILIAIQVALFIKTSLFGPVETLKWRIKPQKQLAYLDWFVSTKEDPVLTDEHMGMLVLQGRPITLQPFEMTQLANAGLWDQSEFIRSINQKKPSAILIYHFMVYPVYTTRWTFSMLKAISENYFSTAFTADTLIFEPYDEAEHGPRNPVSCPGAPWDLPTRAGMGMWWINRQLILMGMGVENTVPIYAVADGILTREPDWNDAVAIKHANPFEPGKHLWVYYAGMADESNERSYIVPDFPPGSEGIPVSRGQLIGYQGRFRNRTIWVHLGMAIVEPLEDGGPPVYKPEIWYANASLQSDQLPPGGFVDPSPLLGIKRSQVMGEPVWLPMQCQLASP